MPHKKHGENRDVVAKLEKPVQKDTLYFDAACPLCSKEIARLKRSAPESAINLVNIHLLDPGKTDPQLPEKEVLLKTLHLQTQDGRWLTGLDANIYAWRSTPYAKLWRLLRLPGIYWLSQRIYGVWAEVRYRSRRYKIEIDKA